MTIAIDSSIIIMNSGVNPVAVSDNAKSNQNRTASLKNQEQKFEAYLADHGRFILNSLRVYEHNPSVRDELYQEVALALWKALPGFREDASIKTFIARITHNIGVSHIRKFSRQPRSTQLDEKLQSKEASPEAALQTNDRRRKLMLAISQLTIVQQQVLTLYLEDFSYRQIAETLGMSEGNVAIRLTRARKELESIMGGLYP